MKMIWSVEYADEDAEAEVERLSSDLRASFRHIVEMIRSNGLERTRGPYVKHIEGKLWEMRLKGRDGIARSLYVTATGRRVVVLRTFVKKTEKTPRREIEIALRKAKDVT
jgi:phage-related protein